MYRLLFFSASLFITACSVDVGDSTEEKKLTYSYTQSGCETGQHSFSSLTDMCLGLANDQLNNNCASRIRCERFQNDCQNIDLGVTCDL